MFRCDEQIAVVAAKACEVADVGEISNEQRVELRFAEQAAELVATFGETSHGVVSGEWLVVGLFRMLSLQCLQLRSILLRMFRVTREIDFCYGHRLLNYDGKCRHLHGHNGRAVISIEGPELDDRGMVLDFADIKKAVSTWIDDNLDHRMILCREDPVVPILQEMGEPLYLLDQNPTAENIAKLIFDANVSAGVPIVEVRLWETPRCYATYVPE